LEEKFETAEVELSETPVVETPQEDSPAQNLDTSLKAGAIMFAQSNDPEMASAVVSAEFANLIAKSTAERMAQTAIEAQDNAIIPRLDAIEMRFEALEAVLTQSGNAEIETQLDHLSKSLESHVERLEGNLTQDRLDTLISLVSASGNNEPETAMSNERLATAIETLLQTMQETLQPEPALMDPYFKQLQLQSEGLIKAISKLEQAEADVASLSAQLSVFRTMAEAAPKENTLSPAEKMETLEEISSGLSSLMTRILDMVGYGTLNVAPVAVEKDEIPPPDEPPIASTELADSSDELPDQNPAETAQPELNEGAVAEPVDAEMPNELASEETSGFDTALQTETTAEQDKADSIEASAPAAVHDPVPELEGSTEQSEEMPRKRLSFDPPPEPEVAPPAARSTPTEEELDRRVEELLKSPRVGQDAPPLQQKTG